MVRKSHGASLVLGALTGCLLLVGGGCEEPVVRQVEPAMVIAENPIDFGTVMQGFQAVRSVELRNDGAASLHLSGPEGANCIQPGDAWSGRFTVRLREGVEEIAPGGSVDLVVSFFPALTGPYTESFTLYSDDPTHPVLQVPLLGTGVAADLLVEPESLDFGRTVVGTAKSLDLVVSNRGNAAARLRLGEIEGEGASLFSRAFAPAVDRDGFFSLAAGDSRTIPVVFAPHHLHGDQESPFDEAAFSLVSATGGTKRIGLRGRAVGAGLVCGDLSGAPSVDFGTVAPGFCGERTVLCRNIANAGVTVYGWEPPQNPGFSVDPPDFPAPLLLEEGDQLEIPVTYCPEEMGMDTGSLAVRRAGPGLSGDYTLIALMGSGGGPEIEVTPAHLGFGLVSTVAPGRRNLVVLNTGNEDLTIAEVVVVGADAAVFSTNAATALLDDPTIPPGGSRALQVTFSPTVERDYQAEIILRSDDRDESQLRVGLSGTSIRLSPCEYTLNPAGGTLDFGLVEAGRLVSREFQIHNVGQSDCLFSGLEMSPESAAVFAIDEGLLQESRQGILIEPGDSLTVPIAYAPTDVGDYQGQVDYYLSSVTPSQINLQGSSGRGCLMVFPREIDFGNIPAPQAGGQCSSETQTVTLYNACDLPMVAEELGREPGTSAEYEVVAPDVPVAIDPGDSVTFDVAYRPTDLGRDAGGVQVTAHPEELPNELTHYVVALTGDRTTQTRQEDRFVQMEQPEVDILFIIDDSCSMSSEQESLANNFASFINFATVQNINYRIAVTTTDLGRGSADDGRFIPWEGDRPPGAKFVTPLTLPSPQEVFALNVSVGTGGNSKERGLQAAYLALSPQLLAGENAGFLRPNAYLSLIFVSDEEDQSEQPVDFYLNYFQNIKGHRNPNLFSASAIVDMAGCGFDTYPARYIDIARRSGGVVESICTDSWANSLEMVGLNVFGFRSRFFLSSVPEVGSIEVYVDGQQMSRVTTAGQENWRYYADINAVAFAPMTVPEPGAQVRIVYDLACL